MIVQREVVRQPFLSGTVRVHGVDFHVAVTFRDEGNAFAIGRHRRIEVQRGMGGQPRGPARFQIGDVDVPAARRL